MKSTFVGILLLIMLGVFLSTMDSGMINVALPTLMRGFHLDFVQAEFILVFYLLTITASLVLWGRLADVIGKQLLYTSGLFLFLVGSGSCYFSTAFAFLLLSRFIQALGAAMMMASGPAIIREISDSENLGTNLGLVGIATACGLMIGPFVAGVLLHHFSWNAIFLLESLIGLMALIAAIIVFRPFSDGLPSFDLTGKIDWTGMILWGGLVIYGIWLLHQFEHLLTGWGPLSLGGLFALLFLFIRVEQSAQNPIVPLRVLRRSYYLIGVITAAVSFGVLFTVLVLIPFFLEYIMHLSVKMVGAVMMAVPATVLFLSPVSGWLYDRIGARILTTFGLFVSSFAMATFAMVDEEVTILSIVVRLAAIGAGQAIFLSPNSASVLSRVEAQFLAVTSGILATARNLGMVSGATIAAVLFSLWFSSYSGGGTLATFSQSMTVPFLKAFQATILCAAAIGGLACLLSAFRNT